MKRRRKGAVNKNGRGIVWFLVIMMIIRVISYYTIPGSAALTQVLKTVVRVGLTGICFLVFMKMKGKKKPVRFINRNMSALFLYYMYLLLAFASLLWTTGLPYSSLQLGMDTECVLFVFFYYKIVLVVMHDDDYVIKTDIAKIMMITVVVHAIMFLIGMFADPATFYRGTHGGEVQRLGGYIINPNELGMLSVVGVGSLYAYWKQHGAGFWSVVGWILMTWCLVATESRSSMISFFLTTAAFVVMNGNIKLIIYSVAAGAAAMPYVINQIFLKMGDAEEVMNMTGRIPFWYDLLVYGFPQKPLLGFGFMRISYHDKFDSIHAYAAGMTHNTFVQVLINLGVVGASLVLIQMTMTFRAFFRSKDNNVKLFAIGMFIPIFINSLTEFGIWGETNYGIMFWLILIHVLVFDAVGNDQKVVYEVEL